MRTRALLSLVLAAPMAAGATDQPSAWDRTLSAINATTPFTLASKGQQQAGWFHGAWDGIKRIWEEGSSDVYLSGYYWHTSWGFSDEDRERYDNLGLGAGFGRTLTDAKGNQRLLYAIVAQDSFEKPMYMAGYGWLARWRIPGNLRLGAGYSITILSNSRATDYIPVPVPVPLASIGTENASIYATYINHIVYFFARLSF